MVTLANRPCDTVWRSLTTVSTACLCSSTRLALDVALFCQSKSNLVLFCRNVRAGEPAVSAGPGQNAFSQQVATIEFVAVRDTRYRTGGPGVDDSHYSSQLVANLNAQSRCHVEVTEAVYCHASRAAPGGIVAGFEAARPGSSIEPTIERVVRAFAGRGNRRASG